MTYMPPASPVNLDASITSLSAGSLTTVARADHVHTVSKVPVLIASTTISTSTVSYTFSNIPSTFTHLRLIGQARSTYAGVQVNLGVQFNSDTSAAYWHNNDNSSAKTQIIIGIMDGDSNYFTNTYGAWDILIPYYRSTTYKSASGTFIFNSSTTTGNPVVAAYGGFWINTSAITSITVAFVSSLSMKSGSQLSLYGLP